MEAATTTDEPIFAWATSLVPGSTRWMPARSGKWSRVFRLEGDTRTIAFLKMGANLRAEHDRLAWLQGHLPVPEVLGWMENEGHQALLLSPLPGCDLASSSILADPPLAARLMAEALRLIHAVPTHACPFGDPGHGHVLTHGDACLPNVLAADGRVTGLVDVGAAGLADRRLDLGAAIWSLGYNLGPGWARQFLQTYGLEPASDEQIEAMRRAYEDTP